MTHGKHRDETIHLRPTADLAERVLLPGDPGRALALAQLLLESPRMFNHHRGLWGYTGKAADGEPLTIQSTGMGCPSAAIVLHELISLGASRAIRVGTCGALDPSLRLGDLVVAREAIAADGTSAALGAGELTRADPALADALLIAAQRRVGRGGRQRAGERSDRSERHAEGEHGERRGRACVAGRIVTTDLFYELDGARSERFSDDGAIAVEMETSALFAVGAAAGIAVACVLAVSDVFADGARVHADDHTLMCAAEAMGAIAVEVLAVV